MLKRYKVTPVAVLRLETVTGNKKALQTSHTAMCQHQNIDTRELQVSEGVAGKTYKEWYDIDEDIREGDVIRNKIDNRHYKVIGVERKGQGMGLRAEHLEVVLVRYNF